MPKYIMPLKGKVGVPRWRLYEQGTCNWQHDLKSMVAVYGAEHITRIARVYEAQFKAAKKRVKVKAGSAAA